VIGWTHHTRKRALILSPEDRSAKYAAERAASIATPTLPRNGSGRGAGSVCATSHPGARPLG